eukprot:6101690-Pyramimonas_sp.AAC.1
MPCGEPITRAGGRICLGKHHDFDAVSRTANHTGRKEKMPCGEPITRAEGRICLAKHHDFDA